MYLFTIPHSSGLGSYKGHTHRNCNLVHNIDIKENTRVSGEVDLSYSSRKELRVGISSEPLHQI